VRVAIDARTLQGPDIGGVGRALANILPLLDGVDIELLLDDRQGPLNRRAPTGLRSHGLRAPLAGGTAWLQLAAPRYLRGHGGVFHCPFYWLPFVQPVPMVVTIHDLTFEDHPEWFRPAILRAFRVQARHAARTAARVITPSAHVRDDILRRYGVPEDRVVVAAHGVDPGFHPRAADEAAVVLDRLGIERPYVLALGGAPRRNPELAEAAWRDGAATEGVGLVVVGSAVTAREGRVWRVRDLADDDFAVVLAAAEALCYTTGYEGFGLPAVEALASATSVVCAPVGALPEVLGDAAEWVDDLSPGAFAAGLRAALAPARAEALRRAGLARVAAMPGWRQAADVHLAAYRAAAEAT
jgi:glycosyltransferase involved in cell wall biosynthesis